MDKILASLFDFSFKRYVTPVLIKYVYMIAVGFAGLQALGLILIGFSRGVPSGIVTLIVAPMIFVFCAGAFRIAMETVLSIIRMTNYTAELARASRKTKPELSDEPGHEFGNANETSQGHSEPSGAALPAAPETAAVIPPPPRPPVTAPENNTPPPPPGSGKKEF